MKLHGHQLKYRWSRYSLRHKRTTDFSQIVRNYYAVPIFIMKSRFWGLCVPHTCLVGWVGTYESSIAEHRYSQLLLVVYTAAEWEGGYYLSNETE